MLKLNHLHQLSPCNHVAQATRLPRVAMDTPSPQISCTRQYSQRPKSHFSADARELLFVFPASTQCELGEVQDRRQPAAKMHLEATAKVQTLTLAGSEH